MPDTTWSVRLDDETKQEILNLSNSSGEQGKEFIQSLMAAYKLKKAEEMQPIASQDLKELQLHINRVQDIYYNLTKRIDTRLKAKDAELEETLNNKNSELDSASSRIAELEAALQQSKNELESSKKTIEEQSRKIVELEDVTTTTKALVAEYKDKNDTLTGLLAEYKSYKAEIEQVKEELHKEKDARSGAEKASQEAVAALERFKAQYKEDTDRLITKQNDDMDRLTAKYEDDMSRLKAKFNEDLTRLNEQHQEELRRTKDTLGLDHKQALMNIQEKHQEEVNKLHESYNARIQELVISFSHVQNEPDKKGKAKTTKQTEDKTQ